MLHSPEQKLKAVVVYQVGKEDSRKYVSATEFLQGTLYETGFIDV